MLRKTLLPCLAAMLMSTGLMVPVTQVLAAPQSCMNYDPDHPRAHHAPDWAVKLVKQRGGDIATNRYDPIWQHAVCDPVKRTVTWHLPGEEMDDPPVAPASCVLIKDRELVKLHGIVVQTKENLDDDNSLSPVLALVVEDHPCIGSGQFTPYIVIEAQKVVINSVLSLARVSPFIGHRVIVTGMIDDGMFMAIDLTSIVDVPAAE